MRVAVLGILLVLGGVVPSGAAPLVLNACRNEGIATRCGAIEVPEDRAHPAGRHLRLFITVVPAAATATQPPLFVLHGGPGAPASDLIAAVMDLPDIRRRRELVFVNQRGTAGANPLRCPRPLRSLYQALDIKQCLANLSARADLRFYGTADFIEDLEAVRAALGYPQIDLLATSYGTRAAALYAKRYPAALHAIVMHGPDPPTHALLDSADANAQRAIDKVFAECRGEALPDGVSAGR
jgi:pimeloyl-ACP methyl ester carboxylesterase